MLLARECAVEAIDSFQPASSAYIHIPFCRKRCFYCDFPITVVGDKPPIGGNGFGTIARYIGFLCREINATPPYGKSLETVFFGGGTPSLLSVQQLGSILETLDRQFGISENAEISMEVDPATFDLAQVLGYRSAGVNRISLGVQAFQSELLVACGRSHRADDVYQAVELLHQAGFENISLDLISGLPHQTLEDWQYSLEQAIALVPNHISCYDLTVESGTPFSRQYKPGISPLPSDETTAEMYRLAQKTLTTAGFEHYEVSNYVKTGYQCRHNRVYWENRPFYGFGMGATSYIGGDRVSRPRKTREYYEWVEDEGWKQEESDRSSSSDVLLDTLMLGLRLAEGLSIPALTQQFGQETVTKIWQCLKPYHQNGWVAVETGATDDFDGATLPSTGRIRLTDPEGFLFSNVILVSLFDELI